MPLMLMYDSTEEELNIIKSIAAESFNGESGELRLITYNNLEKFIQYVRVWMDVAPDITCMDITQKGAIEALEELRPKFPDTLLLIIADTTISPLRYMKPNIMAASLLLRPIDNGHISEAMDELFKALNQQKEALDEECFIIKRRDNIQRLPFSQIDYFESRSKRIFVRTGNRELSIYDTMDGLMAQLPKQFLRCHKGFIVNKYKIKQADFSRNILYLDDGLEIPMSRSYKAQIKERLM